MGSISLYGGFLEQGELGYRFIKNLTLYDIIRIKGFFAMESTLIKDTTKQQRIELIKSWMPQDDGLDDCDIDLFDMYKDYIDGKREIREINESFQAEYYVE